MMVLRKNFQYLSALLFLIVVFLYGCAQQVVRTSTPRPTSTLLHTQSPEPTSIIETPVIESDIFSLARAELVADAVRRQNLENEDVINALGAVPRHLFVPAEYEEIAYEDQPLPIGYGQTISQPSLVARMTEFLELEPGDKVLEIGTGSGYQAAILAELGYVEVYSIEIVPELATRSSEILKLLGYDSVQVKQGDGYFGWEEYAPFDAIIVTAAPDHLPAPLAAQLAEDGILVIPIGPPGFFQTLWKFIKVEGELTAYNMGSVIFVPFTGSGISEGSEPTPTP